MLNIMLMEVTFASLIGVILGTFTGITPGIHINLVCVMLIGISSSLLNIFPPIVIASFIISMSITHTFLDIVPSVFLGAPEEATSLAVLPGHKLLLNGLGFDAIKLTIIGSFFGLLFTIILSPFIMLIIRFVYKLIEPIIAFLLISVVIYMVYRDKKKIATIFVVILSALLGIIVLDKLHMRDPLLPMLSGLFGVSILISSLFEVNKIPEQKTESIFLRFRDFFLPTMNGVFAGLMTGFLPGMGPSQGAIIASQIDKKINTNRFLITLGAIGTVNMVISILTLYTINKARNGSIVAVGKLIDIGLKEILIFFAVSLIAGGIAAVLSLKISKIFAKFITKINYQVLTIIVIFFITLVTIFFTHFLGFIVLCTATAIGYLTGKLNVGRNHLMSCLIVPVILYYMKIL